MRIWDEYPEFFRGGVSSRAAVAPRNAVREEPRPPGKPRGIGRLEHDSRKPVLTLPRALQRQLGLTGGSPTKRVGGARAKESGRAFEAEIELANTFYERRGIAVIYRHHPTIEGWGRTLRVVGKGPADFSGVMHLSTGAAVPVAFDCKVVSGSATYRHAPRDRHQLESLLRFRDAGGRAFLLLCCRVLNCVWLAEALDALWRGDAIALRQRTAQGFAHQLPVLAAPLLVEVAKRTSPPWDYLQLLDPGRANSAARP